MTRTHPLLIGRRGDRLIRQGRYTEAYATYCEAARAHPRPRLAAECWMKAAITAKVLGRRTEQIECSRRSLALLADLPLTDLVRQFRAKALNQLADALNAHNDIPGAERAVRESAELTSGWDPNTHLVSCRLLGQLLLRQGRIGEALTALARMVETARRLDDPLDVADALVALGMAALQAGDAPTARGCADEAHELASASHAADRAMVLADALALQSRVRRGESRHDEAVRLGREALWLTSTTGEPLRAAEKRSTLAISLLFAGETDEAVTLMTRGYTEAKDRGDLVHAALAAENLANALAVAGELDRARGWAEQALSLVGDGRDRQGTAHALLVLGMIRQAQGDHTATEAHLRRAAEVFEEIRAGARTETEHIDLLIGQGQVYRALQRCLVARGDTDGALEAADRVRGLLLEQQRLATTGGTTGGAGAGGSAGTPARTAVQLSGIAARDRATVLVYSFPGPPLFTLGTVSPTVDIWVIAPDGTRRHYESDLVGFNALTAAVAAAVAEDRPGPGAEPEPDSPESPELPEPEQKSSPPEPREREPEAAGEPEPVSPEEGLLTRLSRGTVARDSRLVTTRADLTERQLSLIADAFLRPVEKALEAAGTRRLVIVPDGYLHLAPFNALPLVDGTPLAGRYTVALVLSARLRTAAGPAPVVVAPHEALVVGNPAPPDEPRLPGLPAPALPALHAAEQEARETARLYGAYALLGTEATREAVLERLPHSRFAHFATHALLGEDSLRIPGALCLAPGGSDGPYLRADDIRPLDLTHCRLVVLSACQTGWGRLSPEGNLGLARAFLAAGTDCVIVSLWPVHDTSTADLMTVFHHGLAGGATTGEALRGAVLDTRRRRPNPVDWAGFVLLGSPDLRFVPGG
ncbi:CHAT domain-containing protein [Streptomyces sp. 8N706]|uniref:CHAT domain-containing protein n=1 Tax=Streptomyces sp. 8N706 TaxID=3457416 RepID=UPI003FD5033E